MSDSDFSDVEDAIQPSKPSLMSSVTVRAISLHPTNTNKTTHDDDAPEALQARLGGSLYRFTPLPSDTIVVISRRDNIGKITAAARSKEMLLEFSKVGDDSQADGRPGRVFVNILSEEEPSTPLERESEDGSLRIRVTWSLGDNPAHPRLQHPLQKAKKKKEGKHAVKKRASPAPEATPGADNIAISSEPATGVHVGGVVAPPAQVSEPVHHVQTAAVVPPQHEVQKVVAAPLAVPVTLSQLESSQSNSPAPAAAASPPHTGSNVYHPSDARTKPVDPVVLREATETAAPAAPLPAPLPQSASKPVEYDAATLQNSLFLHVEFVKVLNLKATDPTTYAQFTTQLAQVPEPGPPPVTETTPVVKRNAHPVYRAELAHPIVISKTHLIHCSASIDFQVFEKKLVTAPQLLARGNVNILGSALVEQAEQTLEVSCGGDTKAVIRVTLSASPSPLLQSLHPLTRLPLLAGGALLQFEVVRAELRKEDFPPGVYFALATFHFGTGEIQTERTLAVMNDYASPLWLFKTQMAMKYQATSVDLSIVRSNSLRKTEETVAVCTRKLHICFDPHAPWVELALELGLPPGEAAKKEKSNDAGLLSIKYRTAPAELLQYESDSKRAAYLRALPKGEDELSTMAAECDADPALATPQVLSKYSVKITIQNAECLLFSTPKEKFPDSQLIIKHSGNKECRSNIVRPASDADSVQYTLEAQLEPAFQVQQILVTNCCPSARGKILGRGFADIDILGYQPNTIFQIPVVLEPRHIADGDSAESVEQHEKNFAEDITLLNRANRANFGIVTLSVVIQRLDYWSNSSVLNISQLRLLPTTSSQDLSTAATSPPSTRTIAVWFRNHKDFSIPREHVHLIGLDTLGAMQGALQVPTTFPLNSRGQLAPLCIALLPSNGTQDPLEDLHRTLMSLHSAVEQRVHEVEGMGVRSADEVAEHIYRSTIKEISLHLHSYIEIDLTSVLMEAAKLSDEHSIVQSFAEVLRGNSQFSGDLPLAENIDGGQQSVSWMLHCTGSWTAIAKQLRASPMPDLKVHGFDPLSEKLWVVRARTSVKPRDFARTHHPQRKGPPESSVAYNSMELHCMAREVQVPVPPHFDPNISETSITLCIPRDDADAANSSSSTGDEPFHLAAFVFGPCHNSRTDIVVSIPAGNPVASLKLDMLLRSGTVTAQVENIMELERSTQQSSSPSTAILLDWFHGNRGLSDVEERKRRKELETEWRIAQREPQPQNKLLVTFLGRAEHLEPPRLSGSTLTRCEGTGCALLVGGLGETSQPVNTIFSYAVKEGSWSEWVPQTVSSWETRIGDNWRKTSSFAVGMHASTHESPVGETIPLVFNPRHGHSAAFHSEQQQLIIYGGIGADGFDPAAVTEDGYRDRYVRQPHGTASSAARQQRHRRVLRYGYLGDVWVADLKYNSLRKVTTTAPADTKSSNTGGTSSPLPHHDLRWRHSAVAFEGSMYVLGGKSIVVKAVTVPYNMQDGGQRDDLVPATQMITSVTATLKQSKTHTDTTYYVAEELCCPLDSISVLNLERMSWDVLHATGAVPSPRYGHGCALVGNKVYLFGGRNALEAFNDLYVLDLHSLKWEELLPLGTLVPPPLDLFGFCHSVVDGMGTLVVTGGRTVGAPSQHQLAASSEKLCVYYFNLGTAFWHTMSFSCAPGARRIAPAVCSVTSVAKKRRPSSSSMKRLPFAYAPILQILLVGGERGVVDALLTNGATTVNDDEESHLTSKEESTFFDGSSILPRPAGFPCVLNIAIDPGSSAVLPPQRVGQGRLENIVCSHLRFRDATIPGWALEKSVSRLSTRPATPPPFTAEKRQKPLTKQQQESYLARLNADIDRRKRNQEQRMHDAYAEVNEQASLLLRDDVKQWGDEQWVAHYYRVYYKPAIRYARSRNLPQPKLPPKLQAALSELAMQDEEEEKYRMALTPKRQERENAEKEKQSKESRKLQDAADMSRVNAQLYYQPMAVRKESNAALQESLKRPQSARRVTQQDIDASLSRLHRGPPSPLSSQKFGPSGRGAYSPAPPRR